MESINQRELPAIISTGIPEVKSEVARLTSRENIAGMLQIVVNFVRTRLMKQDVTRAGYCIRLIGRIHQRGNSSIKDIIENLFVRSFNGMERLCSPKEWKILQSKMPGNLQEAYDRQNAALIALHT